MMIRDWRPHLVRLAGTWILTLTLGLPAAALAQDGEADPLPDPERPLEEPHDPFGLGVKKLAYTAGLKIVEVFDDNVLLAPDREESDRITVFLLKARLRYEGESGAASASYRGRERLFDTHDEFDGMEHFFESSGRVRTGALRFEAGVEWRESKEPFDELQVSRRLDSRFDRERARVIGDFNRFDVEAEVARARFTVDDAILDRGDFVRTEAALLAAAEVGAEAALFAEVRYHRTEHDESDFGDLSFFRAAAGARGLFTAKLRGEIRVGLARAELEEGSLFPADDFTGLAAVALVTWDPDPKQEIAADLRREPIESVLTGLAIVDGFRLSYRLRFSERWTFQGLLSWDRERESDGSQDRTGVAARAGVQWAVGDKFYVDAGALFRRADSDDAALEYENLRLSLGAGVQW
jgi:hypothetical protein